MGLFLKGLKEVFVDTYRYNSGGTVPNRWSSAPAKVLHGVTSLGLTCPGFDLALSYWCAVDGWFFGRPPWHTQIVLRK
jgi:hypothetical protein